MGKYQLPTKKLCVYAPAANKFEQGAHCEPAGLYILCDGFKLAIHTLLSEFNQSPPTTTTTNPQQTTIHQKNTHG
jgi:hypothetical protein